MRQFLRRRQQEFADLVRVGWPLIIAMMGLIITVLWAQFHAAFVGVDGDIWWYMVGSSSVLLGLAVLAMVRSPAAQEFYIPVIVTVGAIIVATLLTGGMLFKNAQLAQMAHYLSMLVVIILMLALRLPLAASVTSCLAGLVLASGAAAHLEAHPAWSMILTFYLGSVIIIFFIGVLMQRQEHVNFLQGLLLEYESAERMRLNVMLERLALEDQLTGLANRRQLNDTLYNEWERCMRSQQPLAVLFMDIDYFKRYNDTYGHAAGDQCLAGIAQAIKGGLLRPADMAARYGGEEFVVLLPETGRDGALDVAQRILMHIDALAIAHASSDVAEHVTASIGIAFQIPDKYSSSHDLLERADQALYQAKESGRHRAVILPE